MRKWGTPGNLRERRTKPGSVGRGEGVGIIKTREGDREREGRREGERVGENGRKKEREGRGSRERQRQRAGDGDGDRQGGYNVFIAQVEVSIPPAAITRTDSKGDKHPVSRLVLLFTHHFLHSE